MKPDTPDPSSKGPQLVGFTTVTVNSTIQLVNFESATITLAALLSSGEADGEDAGSAAFAAAATSIEPFLDSGLAGKPRQTT